MQRVVGSWIRVLAPAVVFVCTSVAPAIARAICAEPITCICEFWPTAHVVHGMVRDSSDETSEVEVHEVLAGDAVDPVVPGDVIRGAVEDPQMCGLSSLSFAPGDEVLALWQGMEPDPFECPEADATCPMVEPRLVLVPWGSQLDLGEGRTLGSDSAGILADRAQCRFRFPAPPPLPCNDQILVPVRENCSVGSFGSTPTGHSESLVAWLFGLATLCWSLRARMRSKRGMRARGYSRPRRRF
jgi:hypothetical protein